MAEAWRAAVQRVSKRWTPMSTISGDAILLLIQWLFCSHSAEALRGSSPARVTLYTPPYMHKITSHIGWGPTLMTSSQVIILAFLVPSALVGGGHGEDMTTGRFSSRRVIGGCSLLPILKMYIPPTLLTLGVGSRMWLWESSVLFWPSGWDIQDIRLSPVKSSINC